MLHAIFLPEYLWNIKSLESIPKILQIHLFLNNLEPSEILQTAVLLGFAETHGGPLEPIKRPEVESVLEN